MTEPSSTDTTFVFSINSFVAGIMLGALLAGAYFLGNDVVGLPFFSAGNTALDNSNLKSVGGSSGAISLVNQPAGAVVTIESLLVPSPNVWVAVREVRQNSLGNVLGAERVAGSQKNFTVSLLRATTANQSYAVQLYRDDGNGTFDPATNSTYIDFDTGAPVVSYFTTTN